MTIQTSLSLTGKLAISSILPRQKGGSRTPLYSKYLLSNSPGVLGVSASLSAILSPVRRASGGRGAAAPAPGTPPPTHARTRGDLTRGSRSARPAGSAWLLSLTARSSQPAGAGGAGDGGRTCLLPLLPQLRGAAVEEEEEARPRRGELAGWGRAE